MIEKLEQITYAILLLTLSVLFSVLLLVIVGFMGAYAFIALKYLILTVTIP